MMLVLGMVLFGSTVLLPQFTQILMGWSAQDAGMALSPGGVVVIILMPFVGKMVSKVDARYLIAFGFTITALALHHMAKTMYPGMDFSTAVLIRIFQTSGIAFLFVPINAAVFSGVPPNKSNAVSGIVNLSRNMGGDIGIALVTTLIARRSQVHQSILSAHVDAGSQTVAERLAAMAAQLQHAGIAASHATQMAYGRLYQQLLQQAATLAYLDVLVVLSVFAALMVPAVLMTRPVKPGKPAMAH
jgi:DHA2 family multidrug resistance protein